MSAPGTEPKLLTKAECFAWADKYGETPWNSLAFACAADKSPSPLLVMRSLLELVKAI